MRKDFFTWIPGEWKLLPCPSVDLSQTALRAHLTASLGLTKSFMPLLTLCLEELLPRGYRKLLLFCYAGLRCGGDGELNWGGGALLLLLWKQWMFVLVHGVCVFRHSPAWLPLYKTRFHLIEPFRAPADQRSLLTRHQGTQLQVSVPKGAPPDFEMSLLFCQTWSWGSSDQHCLNMRWCQGTASRGIKVISDVWGASF